MFLLCAALLWASELSVVTLSDGQQLKGVATKRANGDVELVLGDGNVIVLPFTAIRTIEPEMPLPASSASAMPPLPGTEEEAVSPEDPNRVGYFYAPSAFLLGRQHGYLSQKELIFTAAAYGITDWWDIQIGTSLPFLFTETPVGVIGTKLGTKITPYLRFSLGNQTFFVGEGQVLMFFGNLTLGDEDRHITVNGGVATVLGNGTRFGEELVPVMVIGGNYRLGPKTALVTEDWLIFSEEITGRGVFVVPTGGVRLFGPRFATDLGLGVFAIPDSPIIPIPWVGFTWNWSIPRNGN